MLDDDGHRLVRGRRAAVCDKTFRIYSREPYRSHFELVEPLEEIPLEEAEPFGCSRTEPRHPRETKGILRRHHRGVGVGVRARRVLLSPTAPAPTAPR